MKRDSPDDPLDVLLVQTLVPAERQVGIVAGVLGLSQVLDEVDHVTEGVESVAEFAVPLVRIRCRQPAIERASRVWIGVALAWLVAVGLEGPLWRGDTEDHAGPVDGVVEVIEDPPGRGILVHAAFRDPVGCGVRALGNAERLRLERIIRADTQAGEGGGELCFGERRGRHGSMRFSFVRHGTGQGAERCENERDDRRARSRHRSDPFYLIRARSCSSVTCHEVRSHT